MWVYSCSFKLESISSKNPMGIRKGYPNQVGVGDLNFEMFLMKYLKKPFLHATIGISMN